MTVKNHKLHKWIEACENSSLGQPYWLARDWLTEGGLVARWEGNDTVLVAFDEHLSVVWVYAHHDPFVMEESDLELCPSTPEELLAHLNWVAEGRLIPAVFVLPPAEEEGS